MTDLRKIFEVATDQITVDLDAASLAEARRRRRHIQTAVAMTASACLVLVIAGLAHVSADLRGAQPAITPSPTHHATPPSRTPAATTGHPTQAVWDPTSLDRTPPSSISLAAGVGAGGRFQPDIEPGANPVRDDPMTGVVVAWPGEGAGLRLLGTDGRWRSAPEAMEISPGSSYPPGASVISSDGSKVAAATEDGPAVLDVTTGEVTTIRWPTAIAPPWDWAPGLRWLPGDAGLLVLHGQKPWIIELDGDAAPAPYATEEGASEAFGVSPDGPIYQNDHTRNTLVTWEDEQRVHEVPFPQCQRLAASYGLVACTTGSLQSMRSGPVVVDASTGEIVAYAPIKDPNSVYSDNGQLTSMGFLDPETVLLLVGPMDSETKAPGAETWHLVAWRFREGDFARIATGDRGMRNVSISSSMIG